MGVVYRARDPRLDRLVAIKVLPQRKADDHDARERLMREAKAAAALDHPYICKVFEVAEHEGALFLVMEYVAGSTLHGRLQADPIPLSEALRVAGEIAEALQEAHARGFLHRDLKPSNIMLTEHGHVKVMDFGLAKRMAPASSPDDATREMGRAQLTAEGVIVGTPDYMSPEQMKGLALDPRSDQFSFGVIVAEMIGKRHPFRKQSTMETCSAVLSQPPALGAGIPQALARILDRLLAKDVDKRYASMSEVRAELSSATPGSVVEVGASTPAKARWMQLVAGAAAIVVVVAGFVLWRSGTLRTTAATQQAATAPGAIRSIAVLPLDNYSGEPNQDYFAEGMTDELTANLATISQLRVISRGSVIQFKGTNRPPTPELARLLNVDALVEGSVRRSGDNVRITAQLIDARADKHLWARTFERSSRDVLALQGELASTIANEIDVQLTPGEQSRLSAAPTVNPEAYDAYLKGRYFFNRPSDENLKKAIGQFEQSAQMNPTFAPAFSGLSDAYLWAGYNEGVLTGSEARPKAKAAAERAIQLDDNSAEAHTSMAVFKLFYEYDWEGCEREFRRAFALNPNYAFAHDQFGLALAFQGRFDESIAEGKRAAELDPLSPQIPIDNTMAFMGKGDFDAARAQARRAEQLDPTFFFPPMVYGWIDIQAGKYSDAVASLTKAKALEAPAFVSAFLAHVYGKSGDRARALAELEALKKLSLRGQVLPFNLALVYLGLDDRKRALDELERAYASDSQWMGWLGYDRMFDPLRSDPRFVALLKNVHLVR